MDYVTDTHALIWYLTANKRLSSKAKQIFSNLEAGEGRLFVSIVVFLETLVLIEKRRIDTTWEDFNNKVVQFPKAVVYPVGIDILQEISQIGRDLELHDRILATTAKIHGAKLITRDGELQDTKGIETVW